jgi:hypothetical protein
MASNFDASRVTPHFFLSYVQKNAAYWTELREKACVPFLMCYEGVIAIDAQRHRNSPVAQSVEQAAVNRWVAGSSPARGATLFLSHCFCGRVLSVGQPVGQ